MSELPKHRQLRALVRFEDMPVRRVRAHSSPVRTQAAPAMPGEVPGKPVVPVRPSHVAHSGHVGRFYRAKPLQTLPASVKKGQLLGTIKALGLEFPVSAPCTGWVDCVDVTCGAPVEYGQPLVTLRVSE